MYLNPHWDSMSSDDLKVFNGSYMTFQTKPVECTKIIDMIIIIIIIINNRKENQPPLSAAQVRLPFDRQAVGSVSPGEMFEHGF